MKKIRDSFLIALTAGVATFVLASHQVAHAEPQPGDVFREYGVVVTQGWSVEPLCVIEEHAGCTYTTGPVDLTHATRAELTVELATPHLTNTIASATINGTDTVVSFPWPESIPEPRGVYYKWPVTTVAVPSLTALNTTANTFRFKTSKVGDSTHMGAYTTIFGVTLRIYYDAAKKRHPTGTISSPKSGATIGTNVLLAVKATKGDAALERVEYIGNYEDLDVDGDGIYKEWVYTYLRTKLERNMATSHKGPQFHEAWDTSWVPDQTGPVQIAGRIVDATQLTYMTPAVSVKLSRPDFSVELSKSYNVPEEFHAATFCYHVKGCTSSQTTNFKVAGDLNQLIDARMFIRLYWHDAWYPVKLNGTTLDFTVKTPMGPYAGLGPIRPLSALKAGENENIVRGPKYPDGVFFTWPGFQYLLRYKSQAQPETAPTSKP